MMDKEEANFRKRAFSYIVDKRMTKLGMVKHVTDGGGLPLEHDGIYGYIKSQNGITNIFIGRLINVYYNGMVPMAKLEVLDRRWGVNTTARDKITRKTTSVKACNLLRVRDYVDENTLKLET